MFAGFVKGAMASVLMGAALTGPVLAQDNWPSQPIELYVPYSAGSTTDLVARILAEPLEKELGQPIVIEYKTGAGGAVGATALKNAEPDGYTIGLIVSGNVVQPWLQKDMQFDVRTDFVPMTMMYAGQYVLSVRPDFPADDFDGFVAYLKDHPDDVNYGSSGAGTTTHLAGEMLMQMADVKITHIPFQGSPKVFAAIMSGEVQAYFDLYGSAKGNIANGSIKPLAVSGSEKMSVLPDLPAIGQIYPGFSVLAWTGFAAPKDTPKEVTDKLTAALRKVLNDADIRKQIEALGVQPGGNSPEEFQSFIESQYELWGKTVTAAGLAAK